MLEVVGQLVLEIICGVTGHGILWLVTLGRWKAFERGGEVATLVGLLFWILVAVSVVVPFVL